VNEGKSDRLEDMLIPLSSLQHLVFCERQAALIHIERMWSDNPLTLEGSHLHRTVDKTAPRREVRGDLVILRGLPLRSHRLGLTGRADVVELHRVPTKGAGLSEPTRATGVRFKGLEGLWRPYPVDYKRGKPKDNRCDEIQLCAQALCLEEMLDVDVPEGALFYDRVQRRHEVLFDAELRELCSTAAVRMHELMKHAETPKARKQPKCKRCSLAELCLPKAMTKRSASGYLKRLYQHAAFDGEG